MGKKRKLNSKSAAATQAQPAQTQIDVEEPAQEQEEEQYIPQEQETTMQVEEEEEEDVMVEEEVEAEEDPEDPEEEEEEEDAEDEIGDGDDDEAKDDAVAKDDATATSDRTDEVGDGDDDDEPVQKLLEPFSKEQLIDLLKEAADKYADVADRIRGVADQDPAHRKIFVHGLGWDATADTLKDAFKQFGEIEDCRAVTDKISGKSKGYGFILFKRRSGARKALKQPQKKIGNRMTACQLASVGPVASPAMGATASASASASAQARPAPAPQAVSEYTQRKIYVSNVGAELDPQKLVSFFSKYGEIEEGPLGLDKQTGKPKGFCLFVYKSIESAKKALEEPHKDFEGHILHCQKAIDGPKPSKQSNFSRHGPRGGQNPQFRNDKAGFVGSNAGPGHLIAPSASAGIPFNQGAAAAQALNPTLGQALTALLATQGAGLGLTNLLGTLGTAGVVNPVVPGVGQGLPHDNQGVAGAMVPGVMGGYGNHAGYPNQQMGQGAPGRSQHGGHMPYMGH